MDSTLEKIIKNLDSFRFNSDRAKALKLKLQIYSALSYDDQERYFHDNDLLKNFNDMFVSNPFIGKNGFDENMDITAGDIRAFLIYEGIDACRQENTTDLEKNLEELKERWKTFATKRNFERDVDGYYAKFKNEFVHIIGDAFVSLPTSPTFVRAVICIVYLALTIAAIVVFFIHLREFELGANFLTMMLITSGVAVILGILYFRQFLNTIVKGIYRSFVKVYFCFIERKKKKLVRKINSEKETVSLWYDDFIANAKMDINTITGQPHFIPAHLATHKLLSGKTTKLYSFVSPRLSPWRLYSKEGEEALRVWPLIFNIIMIALFIVFHISL